jgi:pimeloyl-ACP methyl ester carboxylesterase
LPQLAPDPTPADGPDPYGEPNPAWLEIDWRRHVASVEVMDTRVNYAELGTGPPIVFVHGLAGCWQNWLENLPQFAAAGYRAIALDLPGFAGSPLPGWQISIPTYAELVDGFCRALEIEDCTLVGNSMGGFISAELAIAQPGWLSRLALVSPAGVMHARMRRGVAETVAIAAAGSARLAHRFRHASLTRPRLRQLAFGEVFDSPELLRPELLWEFIQHAIEAPAFLPAVRGMAGYDYLGWPRSTLRR